MSEATGELDARAGFAGLMLEARQAAEPEGSAEAPYGYRIDPETGDRVPKKAAGRPRSRKSPSLEDLKAEHEAGTVEGSGPGSGPASIDRAPDTKRRARRRGSRAADGPATKPKTAPPQFREGQIERGINQLYRKAGKMIRVGDPDIGQALIDITRKEDPEDVTVGEAWENLARGNPRIRAFLMKMMAGGAWSAVFMAHAPVLMAVMMKDAIRSRLPFPRLMEAAMTSDDAGESPSDGTPLAGLRPEDMAAMMDQARLFADRAMNGPRPADAPAV